MLCARKSKPPPLHRFSLVMTSQLAPEKIRATAMGAFNAAGSLGFIAGPALAGALGATALGEIPPVAAALVISIVAALIIARLPESSPCSMVSDPELSSVHQVLGQDQKECYELRSLI